MSTNVAPPSKRSRKAVVRLRVGVSLVILSWLPFPQIYIWITGLQGDAAGEARLIGWGIEVVVGLLGLALAGAAAKVVVKRVGWRHLPKALWTMLRTGAVPAAKPATAQPRS